jgi:hypothetical protein
MRSPLPKARSALAKAALITPVMAFASDFSAIRIGSDVPPGSNLFRPTDGYVDGTQNRAKSKM